jgi:hypothetical protein
MSGCPVLPQLRERPEDLVDFLLEFGRAQLSAKPGVVPKPILL